MSIESCIKRAKEECESFRPSKDELSAQILIPEWNFVKVKDRPEKPYFFLSKGYYPNDYLNTTFLPYSSMEFALARLNLDKKVDLQTVEGDSCWLQVKIAKKDARLLFTWNNYARGMDSDEKGDPEYIRLLEKESGALCMNFAKKRQSQLRGDQLSASFGTWDNGKYFNLRNGWISKSYFLQKDVFRTAIKMAGLAKKIDLDDLSPPPPSPIVWRSVNAAQTDMNLLSLWMLEAGNIQMNQFSVHKEIKARDDFEQEQIRKDPDSINSGGRYITKREFQREQESGEGYSNFGI